MNNKNVDTFFNSLEELLKLKDSGTTKLAMAIEERKKVEEQLDSIMKSIESAREEVRKLQDENNICLAEMISILETNVKKTDQQSNHQDKSKRSSVLSELKSLFDGSSPEDTTETLKVNFEKSVELCEKKLCEAKAIASEYELQSQIKIAVNLYDESDHPIQTLPVFYQGFRLSSLTNGYRPDLLLLSHIVFSFLKKQKFPLKNEQQPLAGVSKITSLPPTISSLDNSKFVLGNLSSKFILRLFQSGRSKCEIHIRPAPTFHPAFMQMLGDFCYKSPKEFRTSIDKVIGY